MVLSLTLKTESSPFLHFFSCIGSAPVNRLKVPIGVTIPKKRNVKMIFDIIVLMADENQNHPFDKGLNAAGQTMLRMRRSMVTGRNWTYLNQ